MAVGALLVPIETAPAWSETYSHRDATHDVAGRASDASDYQRAATNRTVDITRVRVIHGSTRIRFNVTLRSTSMKTLTTRSLDFKLKTNAATYFGSWQQSHGGYTVDRWQAGSGTDVSCDSMRPGRAGRTIWLSFDRSCAGNPRWIRAGVSVSGQTNKRDFYDLAQSNSWASTSYKNLTPRLRPAA